MEPDYSVPDDYDPFGLDDYDFADETECLCCPECHSDDLNLKWYFFDDDTQEIEGRLMECEDCGTLFNDWK